MAKKKVVVKNTKFMKPMKISAELAAIVGKGPMPRTEVTKKLWVYIKKLDLQDPKNRRNINPDEKLAKVLGKKSINMFEMTKKVNKHLS
jgi:chromatin remodeling complex protein RSC6